MPEVNATCLDSQRLSALGSFVRPSECARQVMRLVVPQCNMLGLPGGFARNFNMWGGVGWGGVGCVNVGVHVYTWYAAGVFMCTYGTLLVCHVQRCYAWGGVGCVNVRFYM